MCTKKTYYTGKYFSIYRKGIISIALLFLFLFGCTDDVIDPIETELEFLGFTDNFALRMVISEPYLFVCAGSDGIWRRNIRVLSDWEYLGLRDTSLGKYANVGALDIDVFDQDILVAYNGSASKFPLVPYVPPSNIVSIWRSTNSGVTWFRSDSGIPESISDTLEYNILTSIQRSLHQKEIIISCYEATSYRSIDDGNTWNLLSGLRGIFLNFGSIRWHPFRSGEAWLFGETSLFAPYCFGISDYGATFKVSVNFDLLGFPSDAAIYDISFNSANFNILHLATSLGLFSTSDGGYTWQKNVIKLPDNGFVKCMVHHPSDGGLIYLAGGKRIYRAKGGEDKAELIGEIERGFITSLAYDLQFNHLFIGTTEGGIYVLKFNGR